MKLLLLGTSGYHPSDERHTACLMLPELGVVLDAGSAMYRVRDHLVTDELDIFLTHPHLDHVLGLTFLFDVLYGRTMQRVTVHADRGTIDAVEQHVFAPAVFPVRPPFEFAELRGPVALPHGGRLSYFHVEHPGGALGFRLDWPGRSMAYVTDTTATPSASYVEDIRGVDLLVHECYFSDSLPDLAAKTGHSCMTPVAEVAAAAKVGQLVLVHINPLSLELDPFDVSVARRVFPNTTLGEDKLAIEF